MSTHNFRVTADGDTACFGGIDLDNDNMLAGVAAYILHKASQGFDVKVERSNPSPNQPALLDPFPGPTCPDVEGRDLVRRV